MSPALAARKDPRTGQWIIECGGPVPPYNSDQSRSGWQPFAGAATGSGNWYGVRATDPYYVAYVDPSTQKAAVYIWQPWHGEEDIGPSPNGVSPLKGPFYIDMSVTADRNGVRYCNTSHRVPPTKQPIPVTPPQRLPGAATTQPAR